MIYEIKVIDEHSIVKQNRHFVAYPNKGKDNCCRRKRKTEDQAGRDNGREGGSCEETEGAELPRTTPF